MFGSTKQCVQVHVPVCTIIGIFGVETPFKRLKVLRPNFVGPYLSYVQMYKMKKKKKINLTHVKRKNTTKNFIFIYIYIR